MSDYVIDEQRMENGAILNAEYFEQILEKIRGNSLSEHRLYHKIKGLQPLPYCYRTECRTHQFGEIV